MFGSFKLLPYFLKKAPIRSTLSIPSLTLFYEVFNLECNSSAMISSYIFLKREGYSTFSPAATFEKENYLRFTGADSTVCKGLSDYSNCSALFILIFL